MFIQSLNHCDLIYVYRDALGSAISSIENVLEFIKIDVLKECEISFSDLSVSQKLRQIIKTLDGDISKMQTSRREAKYEIVISHYCPTWYKSLAQIMEGLSRNLYGFSLAVEREGQIVSRQVFASQTPTQDFEKHDLSEIQKEVDLIALTKSAKVDGTVSRIEYKLISRLQSSVQPEIKVFIQICISVIRCIRHRLQDNNAIPKAKNQTHVCSHHTHQHDLTVGLESLKQAKIILQKEYEQRRAEPQEDHFLIYTILFSLTQFGKKLLLLELEADKLIKRKQSFGKLPRVYFPRVNILKWLGEAGENAKGERNPAEQVIFDQHHLLQRQDSVSTFSRVINDEEQGSGSLQKRISVESDWTEDGDQETIPLQNAPGSHAWNKWLYYFHEWLQTDPVRYAMKFTITMVLIALMAWLPIPGANQLYNVSSFIFVWLVIGLMDDLFRKITDNGLFYLPWSSLILL